MTKGIKDMKAAIIKIELEKWLGWVKEEGGMWMNEQS